MVAHSQVVLQAEGLQDHPVPHGEGQPQLVTGAAAWEQASVSAGLLLRAAHQAPSPTAARWQGWGGYSPSSPMPGSGMVGISPATLGSTVTSKW